MSQTRAWWVSPSRRSTRPPSTWLAACTARAGTPAPLRERFGGAWISTIAVRAQIGPPSPARSARRVPSRCCRSVTGEVVDKATAIWLKGDLIAAAKIEKLPGTDPAPEDRRRVCQPKTTAERWDSHRRRIRQELISGLDRVNGIKKTRLTTSFIQRILLVGIIMLEPSSTTRCLNTGSAPKLSLPAPSAHSLPKPKPHRKRRNGLMSARSRRRQPALLASPCFRRMPQRLDRAASGLSWNCHRGPI
jgi:hypothetical protein